MKLYTLLILLFCFSGSLLCQENIITKLLLEMVMQCDGCQKEFDESFIAQSQKIIDLIKMELKKDSTIKLSDTGINSLCLLINAAAEKNNKLCAILFYRRVVDLVELLLNNKTITGLNQALLLLWLSNQKVTSFKTMKPLFFIQAY